MDYSPFSLPEIKEANNKNSLKILKDKKLKWSQGLLQTFSQRADNIKNVI